MCFRYMFNQKIVIYPFSKWRHFSLARKNPFELHDISYSDTKEYIVGIIASAFDSALKNNAVDAERTF